MDINLVVVNVGNSRLAVGSFIAGEPREVFRFPLESRQEWSDAIADAWKKISEMDNAAIVASTVNPPAGRGLDDFVESTFNRRVVWIGRDIELPINVLTDQPEQTGVDRVLATAAAYEQLGHACVVVDAGTALTVNFCNDNGDFLGGAIAPGASMQLAALRGGTASLPEVAFAAPTDPVGKSTAQAMLNGVYHGLRGMVRETVETYATELGRWPEVIATGGDAEALFGGWEIIHAISPDLVVYGIALAYAEHHIRNGT